MNDRRRYRSAINQLTGLRNAFVVGFTGTRMGMTAEQEMAVRTILIHLPEERGLVKGLHGDCLGADADFDRICRALRIETWCRPCTFESMRAHTLALAINDPTAPMERNRAIVGDSDIMIACPPNDMPIKKGSGTWATIGFARKANKPIRIVLPDGVVRFAGD